MDLEEIRDDIAAFADDEESVVVDRNAFLFSRDQKDYHCKVNVEAGGDIFVEFSGRRLPYKQFLAEELGRLPILAEAVRQKAPNVSPYIDTQGLLDSQLDGKRVGSGLDLIKSCCESPPLGQTRLIFLTADAGEGKTALLRKLTALKADQYTKRTSPWLVLHIDILGRRLLRLEEAIAGDLGRLRVSGLFYSGIIRLARQGLLVLAIDGFDELLAETGSGEAFSALGAVLRQLQGKGVVIAASRTAFFEAENYVEQSRMLSRLRDFQCTFDYLKLHKWTKNETVQYFESFRDGIKKVNDPAGAYSQLSGRLGEDHPVLTRPFLVDRITRTLVGAKGEAATLVPEIGSAHTVVPSVIRAFLRREVEEKWRDVNGQPYLTLEQHVRFLSMIAEEMWIQGDDNLPVDMVQIVANLAAEEVGIPENRRAQIVEMARAHALLTSSSAGREHYRAFDHEEFLNYFLAYKCIEYLRSHSPALSKFLERHSLPKSTCVWIATDHSWTTDELRTLINELCAVASADMKATFIRQNAGAICAEVLKLKTAPRGLVLDGLYFEGVSLHADKVSDVQFKKCTFIDVDLRGSSLVKCHFKKCTITNISYDSSTALKGTTFCPDSTITGLKNVDEPEAPREFMWTRCKAILQACGAAFESKAELTAVIQPTESSQLQKRRKALQAFLRIFERSSGATEDLIKIKLGDRGHTFTTEVLPVLLGTGVAAESEYRGRGVQKRYVLNYLVDDLLRAETKSANTPLALIDFWRRFLAS